MLKVLFETAAVGELFGAVELAVALVVGVREELVVEVREELVVDEPVLEALLSVPLDGSPFVMLK